MTITEDEQVRDVLEYIRRRRPQRASALDGLYPGWEGALHLDPHDMHSFERGQMLWEAWLVAKAWLVRNERRMGSP